MAGLALRRCRRRRARGQPRGQGVRYLGAEIDLTEGLAQDPTAASLARETRRVGVTGREQDWQIGTDRRGALRRLDAVHPGHGEIDEHEIDALIRPPQD